VYGAFILRSFESVKVICHRDTKQVKKRYKLRYKNYK
jgi:hypothetical protein